MAIITTIVMDATNSRPIYPSLQKYSNERAIYEISVIFLPSLEDFPVFLWVNSVGFANKM